MRTSRLTDLDRQAGRSRAALQEQLLAGHVRRRAERVDEQLAVLGRWARRRADPDALAAAIDEQVLLICDVCTIAVPMQYNNGAGDWFDHDEPGGAGDECRRCGAGRLRPYADRERIPAPAERIAQLRTRLPQ